ncbi:nucleoside-diphosphate kinase [Candidatus Woesearchaeota archaeon]|nr:nucleoside-diphosphate kinase [Candidatus Woesearchaeota archaeon]
MEKTLVLIKPDGVQRGLVGEIISRLEKCCLKIVGMKMAYPSKELAGEHYANDEAWLRAVGEKQKTAYRKKGIELEESEIELGQKVRTMLMDYLVMSPIIALCIEGHNAVAKVRKIVGATSPFDAEPGTIRGDFAIDHYQLADELNRPIQNLIHASGTVEEAEREIKIWFNENEIFAWKRVDEDLVYRRV